MKAVLSFLVGLTTLSLSNSAFSQLNLNRVKIVNDPALATPAILLFDNNKTTETDAELFGLVNAEFPDCHFTLVNSVSDDIGFTHARYKEFYKGVVSSDKRVL